MRVWSRSATHSLSELLSVSFLSDLAQKKKHWVKKGRVLKPSQVGCSSYTVCQLLRDVNHRASKTIGKMVPAADYS